MEALKPSRTAHQAELRMCLVHSCMRPGLPYLGPLMRVITVLEAYRKHVAERAAQGIVPQPLNAEQTAGLVAC